MSACSRCGVVAPVFSSVEVFHPEFHGAAHVCEGCAAVVTEAFRVAGILPAAERRRVA